MTSNHTQLELRNSPIHPTPKFNLNDHVPHVLLIITSLHRLGYDPVRLIVCESEPEVTKMIPRTVSSISYGWESASFERDVRMENFKNKWWTYNRLLLGHKNDNKEHRSLLVQFNYLKEAKSLFQMKTPSIRPCHRGRSKQLSHEPTRYPKLYRPNSTYEQPTLGTSIQEHVYITYQHPRQTISQHFLKPSDLQTFAPKWCQA